MKSLRMMTRIAADGVLHLPVLEVHIVFADNHQTSERIIITVYEPDPSQWSSDFTQRIE